ncbi:MAG: hypothetical protein RIR00_2354 [Pseudomonadota bacterium]|jgi:general secretion pathway protein G
MKRRGFTLIELIVVLAIIATLLTLALPRYFGSVDRARETTLRQDLKVMRQAIDQFQADLGRYPKTLDELVSRRYLAGIPLDPLTDSRESWLLLPPRDGKSEGVADIKSGATGLALDGTAYQDW